MKSGFSELRQRLSLNVASSTGKISEDVVKLIVTLHDHTNLP